MKRSALALSILSAILLSACGGSSSNNNAAADQPKPSQPAAGHAGGNAGGSEPAKTPEPKKQPEAKKNRQKAVAKKGGGHAAGGGSSGGTPPKKEKEKTETPTVTPTPTPTPKPPEERIAELKETIKQKSGELASQKEQADKAKKAIEPAKDSEENKRKSDYLKLVLNMRKTEEEKARLAELEELIKQDDVAKEERKQAYLAEQAKAEQMEKALLEAKIEKADLEGEPAAEKDFLAAQLANQQAESAKRLAGVKAQEKANLVSALDGEVKKLQKEVQELQETLNNALHPKESTTKPDMKAAAKASEELTKLNPTLAAKTTALAQAIKDLADADSENKTAVEKAKEKASALETAEAINKNRGLAGEKDFSKESFKDVQKVEFKENKWLVTFTGETEGKDVFPVSEGKQELKGGTAEKPIVYGNFGTVEKVNYGQNATKNSAYGYAGDKFYSVGKITPSDKAVTLKEDIQYEGSAFVKTTDETPENLVAKVTATAHFSKEETEKTLKGSFTAFKNYADPAQLKDPTNEKLKAEIGFTAIIEGNSFRPTKEKGADDADVHGYFYKDDATEFGGLVTHEAFYGAFGGAGKVVKKADQTGTGQP